MSTATAPDRSYRRYRCQMSTRPGTPLQYSGSIDIWSNSDDRNDLFILAVRELRRIAFPTYNAMMWQMSSYSEI